MHPHSSEVVLCTAGSMTLHQKKADRTPATVTLGPGEYAINEPGTWHTADVEHEASAQFITAGLGTQHRPRQLGGQPGRMHNLGASASMNSPSRHVDSTTCTQLWWPC